MAEEMTPAENSASKAASSFDEGSVGMAGQIMSRNAADAVKAAQMRAKSAEGKVGCGGSEEAQGYERTMQRAPGVFLEYDQEAMISNLSQVAADEHYLYLVFLGERFRVNRATGMIQRHAEDGEWVAAIAMEALPIWDFLCDTAPDARPAGVFERRKTNSFRASYTYDSQLMPNETAFFNEHVEELKVACAKLGCLEQKGAGDVNARFEAFEGIEVLFHFWESDDEFPPCFKFIWDANIEQFIKFETTYYVQDRIVRRLLDLVGY